MTAKTVAILLLTSVLQSAARADTQPYVTEGQFKKELSCVAALQGMGSDKSWIFPGNHGVEKGFYIVTPNHLSFYQLKNYSKCSEEDGMYKYYYFKFNLKGMDYYGTYQDPKGTEPWFMVPHFKPRDGKTENDYCSLVEHDTLDSAANAAIRQELTKVVSKSKDNYDYDRKLDIEESKRKFQSRPYYEKPAILKKEYLSKLAVCENINGVHQEVDSLITSFSNEKAIVQKSTIAK